MTAVDYGSIIWVAWFQNKVTKFARFLAKHQHTQRKLSLFCQWTLCQNLSFKVTFLCKKLSDFFFFHLKGDESNGDAVKRRRRFFSYSTSKTLTKMLMLLTFFASFNF